MEFGISGCRLPGFLGIGKPRRDVAGHVGSGQAPWRPAKALQGHDQDVLMTFLGFYSLRVVALASDRFF